MDNWKEATEMRGRLTKKDIMAKFYAPYNFDGARANHALALLQREQHFRQWAKAETPVYAGLSLFSFYNLARISHLSSTGKMLCLAGVVGFPLLTAFSYKYAARNSPYAVD